MSETVIRVENLGKKYIIGHQKQERYTALRDVLADGAKSFGRQMLKPFGKKIPDSAVEEFWALKDVSFEIKQGDRVGIIGRNGAGKSTLLKILSRITEPTIGRISIKGRVASLLEVGTGFHPELTGRENIYLNGAILGMSKAEIKKKFDEIVAFAEVEKFLDTPVKRYSSGMYVRLAFAVAAHLEPEILIVDEVLAVGDTDFQKKCLGKMGDISESQGRTVLFVSHNMLSIEKLCSKGIFLKNGIAVTTQNTAQAINLYLGENKSSVARFENRPVKKASAKQIGNEVELTAEYEVDSKLNIPSLGFVISDYLGNPICGCNPIIDYQNKPILPKSEGTVKVIIKYPKLLNGTYRVSLWFGNGKTDFFHEKDCLMFDVVNMVSLNQLPPSIVGVVFPKCEWIFD